MINFRFHLVRSSRSSSRSRSAWSWGTASSGSRRRHPAEPHRHGRGERRGPTQGERRPARALDLANEAASTRAHRSRSRTGSTDVPVVVVAVRGVDEDAVNRTVDLARQAGAAVPGVVWLEDRWALDDDDVQALAHASALVGITERAGARRRCAPTRRTPAGRSPTDRRRARPAAVARGRRLRDPQAVGDGDATARRPHRRASARARCS